MTIYKDQIMRRAVQNGTGRLLALADDERTNLWPFGSASVEAREFASLGDVQNAPYSRFARLRLIAESLDALGASRWLAQVVRGLLDDHFLDPDERQIVHLAFSVLDTSQAERRRVSELAFLTAAKRHERMPKSSTPRARYAMWAAGGVLSIANEHHESSYLGRQIVGVIRHAALWHETHDPGIAADDLVRDAWETLLDWGTP